MPTKNDTAWQNYIQHAGLQLDGRTHVVTARDLARIANREPRLLTKFNTPAQIPTVLRQAGYCLVAITNGEYLLFKGNIFAPVRKCPAYADFIPRTIFPLETFGRGTGECEYLDHAFNAGLISQFTGIDQLYLTIRGRERTKPFDFSMKASNLTIHIEGVQIETDAGYEGEQDIALVEAKIGTPDFVNIRQLYYPFRHFSQIAPGKRVRTLFFAYDLAAATYALYEFAFQDPNVFDSIQQVNCCAYSLVARVSYRIDELLDSRLTIPSEITPQADDLNKVLELLTLINSGQNTVNEIADYFVFDPRQSHYYGEAAEYLGLITRERGVFDLTPRGLAFITTPPDKQQLAAARIVVSSWIFVELINRARRKGYFTVDDIEQVITMTRLPDGRQRYTRSTIGRRRQTIIAWVRWLTQRFGVFTYEQGRYRLV